jgi:TRAP-type uncharacterized transport system substrate-binding protein
MTRAHHPRTGGARPARRGYALVLAPLAALGVIAVATLRPGVPPRRIVMATGAESGLYHRLGLRYREQLARSGVELALVPHDLGVADNVRRLEEPGSPVQVAIVQGGTIEREDEDARPDAAGEGEPRHGKLQSLGSLFYEPLWIFHRLEGEPDTLAALVGKRVSIGRRGSGSNALARLVLRASGIDPARCTLVELSGTQAAEAMGRGEIDAAMVNVSSDARAPLRFLSTPGVKLMSLAHAEAYTRRLPWLERVTLPRGGIDIARDLPPRDVTLLAPAANLVVRRDLHPALVHLLVSAAVEIHAPGGAFQRYRQFPSLQGTDLPVHPVAKQDLTQGPSLLYRYLPFWWASLLARIAYLLPAAAVLLSVARYAPPFLSWLVHTRINRHYGELRYLEDELDHAGADADALDFARRLDAIEEHAARLSTPVSFSPRLYTLRAHVALVRRKIEERLGGGSKGRASAEDVAAGGETP